MTDTKELEQALFEVWARKDIELVEQLFLASEIDIYKRTGKTTYQHVMDSRKLGNRLNNTVGL